MKDGLKMKWLTNIWMICAQINMPAEQVLLNKQQIWSGRDYPHCYPSNK